MKALGLFLSLFFFSQAGLASAFDLNSVLNACQKVSGQTADQFHSKPVVLTIGATWCSACNALLPRNETLAEKYAGKVEFIEVDTGGSDAASAAQAAQTYSGFSFYFNNPDTLTNALGLQYYPTTYILDRSGNVVFNGLADDDFNSYEAMIESVSH